MDVRIALALDLMAAARGRRLLGDLAREVNLSPSRFAHLFRAEVGVPPARHLRMLRLERARTLVEGSGLTVREIMMEVGWGDPSHFVRDFKRCYGLSPRQLRLVSRPPGKAEKPEKLDKLDKLDKPGQSRQTNVSSHEPPEDVFLF